MKKLALEEIKSLSNEDLGTRLARLAGYEVGAAEMYYTSPEREDWRTFRLCTSLSAIAETEKIVIEKVGYSNYGTALYDVNKQVFDSQVDWNQDIIAITALMSARQKAEAALLALQETE